MDASNKHPDMFCMVKEKKNENRKWTHLFESHNFLTGEQKNKKFALTTASEGGQQKTPLFFFVGNKKDHLITFAGDGKKKKKTLGMV